MVNKPFSSSPSNTNTITETTQQNTNRNTTVSGTEYHHHHLPARPATWLLQDYSSKDPSYREGDRSKSGDSCHEERFSKEDSERLSNASMTAVSRTSTDNSRRSGSSMENQGESRNHQDHARADFSTISTTENLTELTEDGIGHQLRISAGDRTNDLASLALSNGNHLTNEAHDQHSQYPHDHHHMYEPVVRGTEDEAQALAEEATAAVYAKEVLGPPEDADDSEVQVEEELLDVLPPAAKRPRLGVQSPTATGTLLCSASAPSHPSHHQNHKVAAAEISNEPASAASVPLSMTAAMYGMPSPTSGPPSPMENHRTSLAANPVATTQHKVLLHSTSPSSMRAINSNKKVHNEQWNEMLERLKIYKTLHGDCLVPKRYQTDPKLGTWVETQRVQYKRLSRVFSAALGYEVPQPNKRLTAERLHKLQELGFCWSAKHIRKSNSVSPTNTATAVARAHEANITSDAPPKTTTTDNQTPSVQMDKFRIERTRTESLSASRTGASISGSTAEGGISNLNETVNSASGITSLPDQSHTNASVIAFGELTTAASESSYDPAKTRPSSRENMSLSVSTENATIASQAHNLFATAVTTPGSQITESQRDTKTRSLPCDANVHPSLAPNSLIASGTSVHARCPNSDAQWDTLYQRLVQYHEKHGNCLVPRKYPADPKLASWVETQRVLWNRDFNSSGRVGNDPRNPSRIPSTPRNASSKRAASTIGLLSLERKQRLDRLGFVWSLRNKRIDDHWDEMFRQLVEYKNQHGDCLVPSRYLANLKLGKWVETQRYEYTKLKRVTSTSNNTDAIRSELSDTMPPPIGDFNASSHPTTGTLGTSSLSRPTNPRLTPERLRRLESIGFEWKVKNKMKRYYDKQWDGMFQRLLDFKRQHGHVNVPKRFPDDLKLGTWVHTQRIQYRKLIAGYNTKEKLACGAPASLSKKTDDDDGPPTESVGTDAIALVAGSANTATLDEQGTSTTHSDHAQTFRLTEERRQRLEQVGFCWSAREGGAAALITEKGLNGLSSVNGNATEPVVGSREAIVMAGRMTRNSYDDQWDVMFQLLEEYKAKNGDCLVPKRYPLNPKLGTWVDTQRVQYKKLQKKIAQIQNQYQELQQQNRTSVVSVEHATDGKSLLDAPKTMQPTVAPLVGRLTQERIQRLQILGFVWSLRDDWAKHYEELKVFKERTGHCNVPARYAENRRLGIWVSAQRQQYKILQQQKHLKEVAEAAAALEVSPSFYRDETSQTKDETDTALAIGSKARRSAPLTQERIDLLNAIGFTWTIRSRDSLGESWNQRLIDLRRFRQEHGHCLVPSRYEANPELGVWVGTQRTQYRLFMRSRETGIGVSTSMNEDRIRELEELGFVWALRGPHPDESIAVIERADPSALDGTDDVIMNVKGLGDIHSTQSPSAVRNTDSSSGETDHHHHLLQEIEI